MVIFFSIYFTLTPLILIRAASKEVPFSKYRSLLTKNYSKRWLLHMSERQSTTNPYCNLCCLNITGDGVMKDCGYHTLCIYRKDQPQPHCKGFMLVKFTEGEKYMILDAHNTIRNRVASGLETRGSVGPQPRAANMRKLEWDEELASIAEMWVSQCSATHDRCRDVERFPVGQNIAADYASKSNSLEFIQKWYDDVTRFNKSSVSSYSPALQASVGDYTQLVWAESYRVGCARAVFQMHLGPEVIYKEIMACNYGPSGNIPGQPVYVRGTPCSACAVGTKCEADYPALCSRARPSEESERVAKNFTLNIKLDDIKKTSDDEIYGVDEKINYNGSVLECNFMSEFYITISAITLYLTLYN